MNEQTFLWIFFAFFSLSAFSDSNGGKKTTLQQQNLEAQQVMYT